MSQTIGVVRLRALCQEWEEAGPSRGAPQVAGYKKTREPLFDQ